MYKKKRIQTVKRERKMANFVMIVPMIVLFLIWFDMGITYGENLSFVILSIIIFTYTVLFKPIRDKIEYELFVSRVLEEVNG